MADNIFSRTGRYISAAIEDGLERLEQLSEPALMRQAVRETDYAIEKLEHEHHAAVRRLEQAIAAADDAHAKAMQWAEEAGFSAAKGRDDLAQAATEMQQDSEKMVEAFSGVAEIARTEAEFLKTALHDMAVQREGVQRELTEFLKGRRQTELVETFEESVRAKISAILDRAESVMETVSNSRPTDDSDQAASADMDTSRKTADIDAQLAQLKKDIAAKKSDK
ncbi:hypothetical protein [Sphingorhabdus sp. Alg239-R122]|uniref:PspA/IM30 family protein n=1 Tax=Sphingorhabdus sp. Alg239-R122 TaxID=2305989 RepID=UPI0013DB3CC8|nr:hypothetical protein [Sphingorhabdus sp. Alg239-R122]